ncbi:mandelate racemase/muconate lactonizing enzyme family protein [Gordonia sp. LSe1-13]|uniref:Mandelate racemase/muconate lactonizing enzyme family protein n=1 Tax=Gordonia sesuvii TaxID=3116777 RepID=A0ABU7M9E6_9ACTN|nr:mandelate racemase/muconate lactonizing enzyme family protein [Gordonia sp. LSe1-13]
MPNKTRIADVTTHLVDRYCFVQVHAEDGSAGVGQSAYFSFPHVTSAVLDPLRAVLIGQDPDDISRLWLEMYRTAPVRGGALTSTVAAVDIALWDLKGRRYDVPTYELLGGRHRTRVRAHALLGMNAWPGSSTPEDLVEEAKAYATEGFTAVKFDPLIEGQAGFHTQSHARRIQAAVDLVAEVRSAVGLDVDIALEIHRKMDVAESVALADALAPFHIYFYEDALPPDSISEWGRLGDRVRLPIAAGERQDSIYEFADLLEAGVGDFLRPDVGTAGGLTACVKIAALAEARHRRVIAHNFQTPYLTAATLQFYASVPNVGTFEWSPLDETGPQRAMLKEPIARDGGWLEVPDRPGLGVDLSPGYLTDGPAFTAPGSMGSLRTADGGIHAR